MRQAAITVRTPEAATLQAALAPEASPSLSRAEVSLSVVEEALHLEIAAPDTSALRAALNSYLRWASAALQVIEEARA